MNLILFTASYPYVRGGEQNFLDAEMQQLVKHFDRIVIVPEWKEDARRFGNQVGAEVDESYALHVGSHTMLTLFLRGLFSPLFLRGMLEKNFPFFSLTALRRLIAFAGKAEVTRQWLEKWLRGQEVDDAECVYYTYWFNHIPAGIGLVKEKHPRICLISRAHGYDIYEEQYYNPPFWPCRSFALNAVDQLFPCSISGRDYLRNRYPQFAPRYQTSFLGVEDPGFLSHVSEDGVFRIISCSILRPEKRVSLLLEGIAHAAKMHPVQRFEWHHIGNGEGKEYLQKIADQTLPSNARAFFDSYFDNHVLMQFYKENPVDLFVNVSNTEGIPVSIMEAISCGIPILATAVGGNVEIVSEKNGFLLNPNPTPNEIAEVLLKICDEPEQMLQKKLGSRIVWQERYNAAKNFGSFAEHLTAIRKN